MEDIFWTRHCNLRKCMIHSMDRILRLVDYSRRELQKSTMYKSIWVIYNLGSIIVCLLTTFRYSDAIPICIPSGIESASTSRYSAFSWFLKAIAAVIVVARTCWTVIIAITGTRVCYFIFWAYQIACNR